MRLFQILGNQVNIIKDEQFYADTVENYLLDGGLVEKDGEKMTVAVHDNQQDYCEVNGVVLPYPNDFFENVIDGIDTLLAKKAEREYVEPTPPTEAEIKAQLTEAVQAMMDAKAQEKNYDNIHTACTYANSTDEIFRAEGTACIAWRDAIWRKCYDILAEVKAGNRAIPTIEELIAELPVLVW